MLQRALTVSGGGGGINPTEVYNGAFNTNDNGISKTVTSGKTYAVVFIDNSLSSTDTITGGDIIGTEFISYGSSWGGNNIAQRVLFVKATSNTLTISTSTSRAWNLMIIQLD